MRIGCMLLVAGAWWPRVAARAVRTDAVALALVLTPMATPYGHAYDLVVTAIAVVLLAPAALASEAPRAGTRRALALAWLWPGMAMLVGTMLLPWAGAAGAGTGHCLCRAAGLRDGGDRSAEAAGTGAVEKI